MRLDARADDGARIFDASEARRDRKSSHDFRQSGGLDTCSGAISRN